MPTEPTAATAQGWIFESLPFPNGRIAKALELFLYGETDTCEDEDRETGSEETSSGFGSAHDGKSPLNNRQLLELSRYASLFFLGVLRKTHRLQLICAFNAMS